MATSSDLRAWRARKRISQEEAAALLGYSRRAYQHAEAKEGELSPRFTLVFMKAFDADLRSHLERVNSEMSR